MKYAKSLLRPGALLALALSSQAMAAGTNLDVTFTAVLRETTCDMQIEGGTGDNLNNTITIGAAGTTSLADIAAANDKAAANFKLKITECPASLSALKTTVTGDQSGYATTQIKNSVAMSSGGADYVGISIARASAPDTLFVINSQTDSERLVWTPGEISAHEVALVAQLRETRAGSGSTGAFSATATFNFTYE